MKLLPECVAVGVGAAVAASTVAAAGWSPRAREAINPIQSIFCKTGVTGYSRDPGVVNVI